MSAVEKHNVKIQGTGDRTMVFAHGFGCDQNMWRFVEPAFRRQFRTVLFDHVGAGQSNLSEYDPKKYETLAGYAEDVVALGRELELSNAVFVGHSVSAMIGALASIGAPELFGELVMVCPSPRYINDDGYIGGFTAAQIESLLVSLSDNYLRWSATMAPAIMGNPNRPELGEELTDSFCRTDPDIARQFARATFTADNRSDLGKIKARTLILQCKDDIIASEAVGEYVHAAISGSEIAYLDAFGHCPNLSAPAEVITAMRGFV